MRTIKSKPRTSVVAHLKGVCRGRSLNCSHTPTAEAFRADSGWKHDPFKGEIVDGKLYGWALPYDLSGIAAGLRPSHCSTLSAFVLWQTLYLVASSPSKQHVSWRIASLQHD